MRILTVQLLGVLLQCILLVLMFFNMPDLYLGVMAIMILVISLNFVKEDGGVK